MMNNAPKKIAASPLEKFSEAEITFAFLLAADQALAGVSAGKAGESVERVKGFVSAAIRIAARAAREGNGALLRDCTLARPDLLLLLSGLLFESLILSAGNEFDVVAQILCEEILKAIAAGEPRPILTSSQLLKMRFFFLGVQSGVANTRGTAETVLPGPFEISNFCVAVVDVGLQQALKRGG